MSSVPWSSEYFFISEAICIALQLLLFIPFYLIYKKDCKEIGVENLAVPLLERFIAWILYFPLWIIPIIIFET